ncbi:MAG: tetratricopeptide repeat protein [Gammaproteobacteria bacterium]|nr:tetratricopeptide repeat protein [Gammaproteobacteria bacterium]
MAYNQTDKEQIEDIKKWWRQYGKYLMVAVIIGLGLGFSWRYWQRHQLEMSTKASRAYDNMLVAVIEKKPSQVNDYARSIQHAYPRTPYAALAGLLAAKEAVTAGKLNRAYQQLNWVLQHSNFHILQQIASLRAARVLLAQHKPELALRLVKPVRVKSFMPLIHEVRGDIYLALKNKSQAKTEYQQAKTELASKGITNPIINMKLASI